MKVRAISLGYYGHVRVKSGTVFEMDDKIALARKGKDGKPVLPRWVVPADQPAKKPKGVNLPGAKVVASKTGQPAPLHDPKPDQKDQGESKPASTGDQKVI